MGDTIPAEITELTRHYPRFEDGRIDYTHARICFAVNCTVVHNHKILLAYRGADVIAYPGTWSGISGFIDEIKPLKDTVRQELAEEAGIGRADIKAITVRDKIVQPDASLGREWHVFPVLVELKREPEIVANWENQVVQWVPAKDVMRMELMPGFAEVFHIALGAKRSKYASQ